MLLLHPLKLVRKPLTKLVVVMYVAISVASCGGSGSSSSNNPEPTSTPPIAQSSTYSVPVAKADDWQVASAIDLDMDVSLLEQLLTNINSNTFGFRNMDGVLIVKDNQLVFERQLRNQLDVTDGWANNQNLDIHAVHSVTKSVMSAAIGIAIDRGDIGSKDDLALSYFSDYTPLANDSQAKQQMTIENWLTMQHGLQWNEWNVNYLDDANQNKQMIDADDPMRFLLDLPSVSEPDTDYAYSTGISFALGRIISRTSGQRFYDYVRQHLLEPMNIQQYDAWFMANDAHAGSALYLTMRGMAKFGQMYLDQGQWMGQQIVPASWVAASTQEHVAEGNIRYGYQWWINTFTSNGVDYEAFYANGWGGQFILVFPQLNSVVVLTGHRYEDGQAEQTSVRTMLQDYIIPFLSN